MNIEPVTQEEAERLADLRAIAMKPSLEALGRYDVNRVRNRFLDTFLISDTFKIMMNNELVGFYVLRDKRDHFYLDHLYIHPNFQNLKLGKRVLNIIIEKARERGISIRLGALRNSPSNRFYLKNGFLKIAEDEFDIYYEYQI